MNKAALVKQLREVSAWTDSYGDLVDLPGFDKLLFAAQELGHEDYENASLARFPGEFHDFCEALANFIVLIEQDEANLKREYHNAKWRMQGG